MEKKRPHYNLTTIQEFIKEKKYFITKTAYKGAFALNFDEDDILNAVINLTNNNFYKSMTTNTDHKKWQDVYYLTYKSVKLYIKLQLIDEAIVISFKENIKL
jgi:motility quorum-sensing regulator/GCU-specific mRNA interferase toxin